MSETFSESDLEPSAEEASRKRRLVVDRVAVVVAVLAAGLVVGGMLALGACAAPMVFRLTPAPYSGNAMGAAFARFDRIAIGASCALLAAEVVRTYLARRHRQKITERLRRFAGIGLAGAVTFMGLVLSPEINDLHTKGVRRGEGELGMQLEATHKRAEMVGRLEAALGLLCIALHVFTLRTSSDEDEDDLDAPAPLPPGPR
ncbi:MAG: DUF4149 domain-containing protein [Myxococcales bacterium]|nr:DUF4149 domain-containing protein [Myxococcales bacterium]